MKKYGLIGKSLKHSFSKDFFTKKFAAENIEAVYENFEIEDIARFPDLLEKEQNLAGISVTIPYKTSIMPYLQDIDQAAATLGAVNAVTIGRKNNQIYTKGYNTDIYGFKQSLLVCMAPHHRNALILGTGGASKAVAYVLKKLGINYQFVSRNPKATNEIAYPTINQNIIENNTLIVNTTPVGQWPNVEVAPPLPYNYLTDKHLLFDLIYNPEKTRFLQFAENQGAAICNGLQMLHLQAEKAWDLFNQGHI